MTHRAIRQPAGRRKAAEGWLGSLPELGCAVLLVLSTTLGVYAYAGLGAAVFAAGGWAIVLLALLPTLIPAGSRPLVEQARRQGQHYGSFLEFWWKRRMLREATDSLAVYDSDLRPALQHLLAARLAERHGVSLYNDPAAARRLLLRGPRDDALWFWLDPARPAEADKHRRGIPVRALTAIIDRLERL